MGKIAISCAAAALVTAAPLKSGNLAQWQPLVAEAAERFSIPESWIWNVMTAESGGRQYQGGKAIRSHAGAMGLMQLMPATWAMMQEKLQLGSDPDDPRDNIMAGAAYLRAMYDSFGYPGAFAAYNAGPARYAEFLSGKRKLPQETRAYVRKVTLDLVAPHPSEQLVQPTLFAKHHDGPASPPNELFAIFKPLR